MKTPLISILFFLLASFFGAVGQLLYKTGSQQITSSVLSYLNPRILGGIICYVLVMALFVAGFKKGGELSALYPVYATTFIWAALLSLFIYAVPIKPLNILGMVFLIAGMYLMGK